MQVNSVIQRLYDLLVNDLKKAEVSSIENEDIQLL